MQHKPHLAMRKVAQDVPKSQQEDLSSLAGLCSNLPWLIVVEIVWCGEKTAKLTHKEPRRLYLDVIDAVVHESTIEFELTSWHNWRHAPHVVPMLMDSQ